MKRIFLLLFAVFSILIACKASQDKKSFEDKPKLESDTIRISNEELKYDIIIVDPGFTNWFNTYARPRNYYTQSYMESRNKVWILEWNIRAQNPKKYGDIYDMMINYQTNINYGFEVNYMLYNYLIYFQLTYKQQLGGYTPRI
jgi:thioredoxin-related protein